MEYDLSTPAYRKRRPRGGHGEPGGAARPAYAIGGVRYRLWVRSLCLGEAAKTAGAAAHRRGAGLPAVRPSFDASSPTGTGGYGRPGV